MHKHWAIGTVSHNRDVGVVPPSHRTGDVFLPISPSKVFVDSCATKTVLPGELEKHCENVQVLQNPLSFSVPGGSNLLAKKVGTVKLKIKDVEGCWRTCDISGYIAEDVSPFLLAGNCVQGLVVLPHDKRVKIDMWWFPASFFRGLLALEFEIVPKEMCVAATFCDTIGIETDEKGFLPKKTIRQLHNSFRHLGAQNLL